MKVVLQFAFGTFILAQTNERLLFLQCQSYSFLVFYGPSKIECGILPQNFIPLLLFIRSTVRLCVMFC